MALKRKDWLDEGFKLLSEFAQDKLRMQYLCERLNVTKGSFYHHFNGIDHYIEGLMEAWEEANTLHLIKEANKAASPGERMEILSQSISSKNQSIEAAIRSWSFYNPMIARYMKKVDNLRLKYLQQIFIDLGASEKKAALRAELDYGALIGIQFLFPNITREKMEELWEEQKTYIMNL